MPGVNNCITPRESPVIISGRKLGLLRVTMQSRKGHRVRSIHASFKTGPRLSTLAPRLKIHSCPNCVLIERSGKWCFIYHHIFGILPLSRSCFVKFVIKSKSITNFIIFIAYPVRKDRVIKGLWHMPNIRIPPELIVRIRDVIDDLVGRINVARSKADSIFRIDVPRIGIIR